MQFRLAHMLGPVAAALTTIGAVLVLATPTAVPAAVLPTIYVNYVATSCTFTIVGDSGAPVTTIAPGTYQLLFTAVDYESCPNGLPDFQLTGPGVSIRTPVDAGTGNAAEFTITLQPGSTYQARDNNQPVLSALTFTTQASGSPATVTLPAGTASGATTTSSSTDIVGSGTGRSRGTLSGSVATSGTVALSFKGAAVSSLKAGKYTVVVVDRSRSAGLYLSEGKRAPRAFSGTTAVGRHQTTIILTAGQWYLAARPSGPRTAFVVTAH